MCMYTHMDVHTCTHKTYARIVYLRILNSCQVLECISLCRTVVASLLKEGLAAMSAFSHQSPTISFKRILFQQLNKPWTAVNRCAGILAQHGKADYAEALISKCLGYCVRSSASISNA